MRPLFAALSLIAVTTLAGCYVTNVRPPPASLRVTAVPETARVFIDERFAASARVMDVHAQELRPGRHRLTVEAPGYFPHDLMLDLPSGETHVEIELRPVP